jgi:hypothetical protein
VCLFVNVFLTGASAHPRWRGGRRSTRNIVAATFSLKYTFQLKKKKLLDSTFSSRDDLPKLIDIDIDTLNTKDNKKTEQHVQGSKCRHEDRTCCQNITQGFLTSWMIAYASQYLLGILPCVLTGKVLQK